MALKIDTDSLKKATNLVIEAQLTQQLGLQIFNNLGSNDSEYKELCIALEQSVEKIIVDAEKLKSSIPVI